MSEHYKIVNNDIVAVDDKKDQHMVKLKLEIPLDAYGKIKRYRLNECDSDGILNIMFKAIKQADVIMG